MGYCLNSKERFSEAINYLKTAIEKEPTYTAAYVELGYAYYKTGKDQDAETSFSKALELNPKNENARYYACLMYIKQKNKAKAQKMVDELKALSSQACSYPAAKSGFAVTGTTVLNFHQCLFNFINGSHGYINFCTLGKISIYN